MDEYKYKAFISYRHLSPDMNVAEKLQKLLESYKPPKSIGKKGKWRLFRDVSELPTSSDLSDDINKALEDSEHLIVICSEKYNESKWCMQELERFRELHGGTNDNIVTLLVEGEPHDAFPEVLTYREVDTVDENGEQVRVKVDIEPLAADVRAASVKGSLKKLKTEYLRIAAPLLGCDFNDLFQREKKRQAKRRLGAFVSISAVLALIAGISLFSALTISKKNKQIENQNVALMLENSQHLASESEMLYESSRLLPAIEKSLEALPSYDGEKPVAPEAEYALSKEMDMFEPDWLAPRKILEHDSVIGQIEYTGNGKTITSSDSTGIYFWDAKTGKLIKKITPSDDEFASEKSGSANKLYLVYLGSKDVTGTIASNVLSPGSYVGRTPLKDFDYISLNYRHNVTDDEPGYGGDVLIYNSDGTAWRLDGETGEIIWKLDTAPEAYTYYTVRNTDSVLYRIYVDSTELSNTGGKVMGHNDYLEVFDIETGELLEKVNITDQRYAYYHYLNVIYVKDKYIYAYNSGDNTVEVYEMDSGYPFFLSGITLSTDASDIMSSLYMREVGDDILLAVSEVEGINTRVYYALYDAGFKDSKKWSFENIGKYNEPFSAFRVDGKYTNTGHDYTVIMLTNDIIIVDDETGEVIFRNPISTNIISYTYTRNGFIYAICSDGSEYAFSVNGFADGGTKAAYQINKFSTELSFACYSRGQYVTSEAYSNKVYIQYTKPNPNYTEIDCGDDELHDYDLIAVSDDGRYAAYTVSEFDGTDISETFIYLFDADENSSEYVLSLDDSYTAGACFSGDGKQLAVLKKDGTLYTIDCAKADISDTMEVPEPKTVDQPLVNGDRICYLSKSGRALVSVGFDGSHDEWNAGEEDFHGDISYEKYIKDAQYSFSPDGMSVAVFAYDSDSTSENGLYVELYSFDSGKSVILRGDIEENSDLLVRKIFWMNNDTVGVFYSDMSVVFYNTADGSVTNELSLTATGQEAISVTRADDSSVAVICRNGGLYRLSLSGELLQSAELSLADTVDMVAFGSCTSENAAYLTSCDAADSRCFYIIWDRRHVFVIDRDSFKVRYQVTDCAFTPVNCGRIYTDDQNMDTIGYFPVYTTQQLVDAAEDYLGEIGG